ncbi:multidrug effflux MFS transporter [Maritimibacter sp. UBA3975]|uniref:multidrug effflux MFS transporter n=1 Tax=Maritimibacter sp. UBA3975 TaxID=1946833 RepID=UPI000C090121|nr:multidrug effflux MFS transporter [Maritimibacter sp. UBA3975]MAM62700.1 Bcr/CflA family drug resistance efflux transporter [Maritimibacter sp.]|tara:strand:+ start:19766 stop:20986 length:1221 start_codon:yes stop_codon:yes gene_type:complete
MSEFPPARLLDRTTPPHVLTLIMITGVAALSMSVFLPALPVMADDLGTSYQIMQLSVAIYLAVNAALQVILGPISDRFGRRPVLIVSFAIYVLASLGCMLSTNVVMFLIFRMLQAFVVTGLVLSRAVIRDMLPPERSASMIAYVTMGMSIVPMAAPAVGGFLSDQFGWQSTFLLQILLGVAVLVLILRDLGETHPRGEGSLMDQLRAYPELLRSPRFWGYSLAAMFCSGGFFAYLGGAPFVGSEIFHISPSLLGVLLGAPAVGYLFGNFIAGRYSVRTGINVMILMGAGIFLGGLLLSISLHLAGLSNAYIFFGLMGFVGLGNGMALPNANAGLLSVRPNLAGSASGLGGALMIGGGAAISAFVGSRLTTESGPDPLLWLMLASAVMAVLSILIVIRRENRLAALA